MFILCDAEHWERELKGKHRRHQHAFFIAVYRPLDRDWMIHKNRYGYEGLATESEFEDMFSEALSQWGADSVKAGNRPQPKQKNQQQAQPAQKHPSQGQAIKAGSGIQISFSKQRRPPDVSGSGAEYEDIIWPDWF